MLLPISSVVAMPPQLEMQCRDHANPRHDQRQRAQQHQMAKVRNAHHPRPHLSINRRRQVNCIVNTANEFDSMMNRNIRRVWKFLRRSRFQIASPVQRRGTRRLHRLRLEPTEASRTTGAAVCPRKGSSRVPPRQRFSTQNLEG